jgi:hypothetical protein
MKKLLLLLCLLLGCKTTPYSASSTISHAIDVQQETTEQIDESSDIIEESSDTIRRDADGILDITAFEERTPEIVRIEDNAKNIIVETNVIENETIKTKEALEDLNRANEQIRQSGTKVAELEKEVADLSEEDAALRREAIENFYGMITLFYVIGFAGLILGIFMVSYSKKLGGTLILAGLLILGFATASVYYLEEIAAVGFWITIAGIIAAVGTLIYLILRAKTERKTNDQVVELVEVIKEKIPQNIRKELFSKGGLAYTITDPSTKKIINEVKVRNGFKHTR